VRQQRGAEQAVVGRVGEDGLVNERIVGKLLDGAQPEVAHRGSLLRMERIERRDGPEVDRSILRENLPQ
jgi:hypothetical protein